MYQHNLFPEDDEFEKQFAVVDNRFIDGDAEEFDGIESPDGFDEDTEVFGQRIFTPRPLPGNDRDERRVPNRRPGPGPDREQGITGRRPPAGPPPDFVPKASRAVYNPNGITRCLFDFVYIWRTNGRPFWFYPIFTGGGRLFGYRWTDFGWAYSGITLSSIEGFFCRPF